MAGELSSVESVLEKYIPEEELGEVKRILFGRPARWPIYTCIYVTYVYVAMHVKSQMHKFAYNKHKYICAFTHPYLRVKLLTYVSY